MVGLAFFYGTRQLLGLSFTNRMQQSIKNRRNPQKMQIILALQVADVQELALYLKNLKWVISGVKDFQGDDRKYKATELPQKHVKMRRKK